MNKKYELTDETIEYRGHTLHRIKLLEDIRAYKAGKLCGYIESEDNLSHECDSIVLDSAKVYGAAKVYGGAEVSENAEVSGNARVYDCAVVSGNARVYDCAEVGGLAEIYDNAEICGDAKVHGDSYVVCNAKIEKNEDYIVFKNFWSSGRYFTWTRSNNKWKVGCFYGTGEELIAEAYEDSERSGREYERIVRYVESILADEAKDKTE